MRSAAFEGALPAITVLLVEDERLVRLHVRAWLEQSGLRVLEASSGTEALVLSREHAGEIDLLLTDLMLPGLSGTRVAASILAERPELCVVYMSASHMSGDATNPPELGRNANYLEKPFGEEELKAILRSALAAKREAAPPLRTASAED